VCGEPLRRSSPREAAVTSVRRRASLTAFSLWFEQCANKELR